jgi:hypothetical protein
MFIDILMVEPLFPALLLQDLLPGISYPELVSLKVEEYIHGLVGHLVLEKSQSRLVNESIVAIPDQNLSSPTVRTRDACRTIRNFSGISIPDVTAITRLPAAMPEQSSMLGSRTSLVTTDEQHAPLSSFRRKDNDGVAGSSQVAHPSSSGSRKRGRPRKVAVVSTNES